MSLNKVLLIGNVGKDPEVRYVSDNLAVANFSVATTKKYIGLMDEEIEDVFNGLNLGLDFLDK